MIQADTYLQLLDLLLVSGFLGTAERSLSGGALMSSLLAWGTAGALSLQHGEGRREKRTGPRRGGNSGSGGADGRRGRRVRSFQTAAVEGEGLLHLWIGDV